MAVSKLSFMAVLFLFSVIILSLQVHSQSCTLGYDPPCEPPLERACGCGGSQTRATACGGGCTDWNDCRIGDIIIPVTESSCNDGVDEDCDSLTDCDDPDCGAADICADTDGDGFVDAFDCADEDSSRYPGAPEVCNNLDDDCDGAPDEGLTRPCGSTDIGICTFGTESCRIGAWVLCTAVLPQDEICDALDNDCDGQTDEGCSCVGGEVRQCGSDIGACAPGTQTCVGGAWEGCTGAIGPVSEVCGNGIDDDCDGDVDELCTPSGPDVALPEAPVDEAPDVPGTPVPAGPALPAGPEASLPAQRCVDLDGDGFGEGCRGPDCDDSDFAVHPGVAEICDAVDNDCNGRVDEGLTSSCGSTDVGVCTFGRQTCTEGRWGGCDAVLPSQEQCGNGLDDDCDGGVDEDCEEGQLPPDQSALKQFLDMQYGSGNYDFSAYLQRYLRAQQFLDIKKHSIVVDGRTTVLIDLSAVQDLYDVTVYEYIPKHIASSVDKIEFSVEPEIIQADPLVAWHFEELTGKEDLRYYVEGEFEGAAEKTSTMATVGEAVPKVRAWYVDLLPLLFIPILGLVFIVLIQLVHRRMRD